MKPQLDDPCSLRSITPKSCQTCHPRRVPAFIAKKPATRQKNDSFPLRFFHVPDTFGFWHCLGQTHTLPLSLSLNYPPPSRIYPVILPLTLPALTPSPPILSIAATALIISRLERLPSSPPARPWPVRSQRSQTSPIGPGNLS